MQLVSGGFGQVCQRPQVLVSKKQHTKKYHIQDKHQNDSSVKNLNFKQNKLDLVGSYSLK
jgi:hypothetical protein